LRLRRHIWSGPACGALLLLLASTPKTSHAQLARELGLLPADATAAAGRGPVLPTESAFALSQLQNERVMAARVATRFHIKRMFEEKGIRYPAAEMFIRIFKRERTLELWVRPDGDEQFRLLKNYGICALAGDLGPKKQQGDSQVPEGFYAVDFFNPWSEYHLSLHVDYPNVRDRYIAPTGINLGGDIFIHGGCNSEGCLALTDEGIRELYWMAVEARAVGQQRIPVHIFPARLGDEDMGLLERAFSDEPELPAFWQTLKPGYEFFEKNRRIPAIVVNGSGDYIVTGAAANASVPVMTTGAPRPAAAPGKPTPTRRPPLGVGLGG
jgi:murein L,D-transpeptidase YafK